MKKVFFGLAAISLIMLVTSCNNETVEVNNDLGNVLAFKAATGKQTLTRASEVNITTLQGETLTVETYKGSGEPYSIYEISYVSGHEAWFYGTPEYHPLKYNLYHYSVYPYDEIGITNEYGVVTLKNFTVEETAADQVDLMVASTMTTPDNGRADLLFKHILTQVNFAIQGKENLIVQISDITLTNINSTSTYTFGPASSGVWDTPSDFKNYTYTLEDGTTVASTTGLTGEDILYLGNKGGADPNDNANSNALMLLPQTLDNAILTFNFALFNKEKQDSPFDSGIASVNLSGLGGVSEWLEGRRYLYKLIFDPHLLEFYVDVVEGWIDAENTENHDGVINVNTPNTP